MAWTFPPPPNTDDVASPVWRDWFYRLGRQVEVVNPEGTQPVQAGQVFGRREVVISPSLIAQDSQSVGAARVFAPPLPRPEATPADGASILATQIFGA